MRAKSYNLSRDIILPYDYIKPVLPDILPIPVINIIYSYYRGVKPYVKELQEWFGEDSDNRNYHDNEYEAQQSLIYGVRNVLDYFPKTNIHELVKTDYFKSHTLWMLDDVDDPTNIEVKNISELLCKLKNKIIPYDIQVGDICNNIMSDYSIPFESNG